MAFTDDFSGHTISDELSVSADWTNLHIATPSHEFYVDSAYKLSMRSVGGTGDCGYTCPDQSSGDHYTEIDHLIGTKSNVYPCCVRMVDIDNFVGGNYTGTGSIGYRMYKFIVGTKTAMIQGQSANVVPHTMRVEAEGTAYRLFEDGIQIGSDATLSDADISVFETKQGVRNDGVTGAGFFDNFAAGAIVKPFRSYYDTTPVTSIVIDTFTAPSEGDTIIYIASQPFDTGSEHSTPTGFTLLDSFLTNNADLTTKTWIFEKEAGASEPTVYNFSFPRAASGIGTLVVFDGILYDYTTLTIGANDFGNSLVPTSPSVTPATDGAVVISGFANDTNLAEGSDLDSQLTIFLKAHGDNFTQSSGHTFGWFEQVTAGATGSFTHSLNESLPWAGFSLYIEPVSTGGLTVSSDYITNTPTLYEPSVNAGAVNISSDYISSASSIYEPEVSALAVNEIAVDYINSAESLYEPTVNIGAVALAIDYIASSSLLH